MSAPGDAGVSPRRSNFFRSAGIISAAIASSRITGLVREMVMSRLFGAGALNDAFQVGFRIPNLTRNLFAEGALSSAFIPTLTQCLTRNGKRDAVELSNTVTTALLLAVGAVCVAGIVWSPELVRLMAPGFERVPGKFELAVLLTRIMFPFLLTIALAAQAMGVLNACDRFGVPATASTCFNVASVLIGVTAGFTIGRHFQQGMILSMACGVVAGGVMQFLWQVPSLRREGFSWRPRLDLAHPGLRQIARLMLPAILGSAAVQINIIVNTNLASGITDASGRVIDGPVSWLGYAFRFMQLPLGLFGVAIASATLPAVSRSAAIDRMDEFRDTLARSLGTALLLTIPSSAGLAVLGESMIGIVYQGGRFGPYDTHQTAIALACYSLGLAGYAAAKILGPAFYALHDARTPVAISIASIAVNLPLAMALVRWLGHAGLALATSLVVLLSAAALFALLSRRVGGIHGAALAISSAKIAAAAAGMAAICRVASAAIHSVLAAGRLVQAADLAICIPLGLAVFYVAARALHVGELEAITTACYTFFRNAPRPEAGDPTPGH
jgi:putative peptidoglycan lipid II flippase